MFRLEMVVAIGVAGLALPVTGAAAQSSDARLKMMEQCDSIKSESIRLTCYDNAIRNGRSSLGADQLGMQHGKSAAQPLTPEQRFGMTPELENAKHIAPSRPLELEEVNARVASASDSGIGLWRITLADGARWQFAESDRAFRPPTQGEEVRIRKASMGSYLLSVGRQASVRVVRVN